MNLSTPCGLSTRLFSIVLLFIGVGVSHAQLNLPKTLDDPGVSPAMELIGADHIEGAIAVLLTQVVSANARGIYQVHTDDTELWVTIANEEIATEHYLLSYTNDSNTTPVPFVAGDRITKGNNYKIQIRIDPFKAYEIENDENNTKEVLPYFGTSSNVGATAVGTLENPESGSKGTTGTPIRFSSDELLALGDGMGMVYDWHRQVLTPHFLWTFPFQLVQMHKRLKPPFGKLLQT